MALNELIGELQAIAFGRILCIHMGVELNPDVVVECVDTIFDIDIVQREGDHIIIRIEADGER